jgi:hypothetical protein
MNTYRQGDILFLQKELLPPDLQLVEQHDPILVEGEVTGHAHQVETLDTVRILSAGRLLLYLQVMAPVRIVHQEHHPITLPIGLYEIRRQREYTPEAIRMVMD